MTQTPSEVATRAAVAGREAAPRLLLFNVKYSPNLGDGLLAECLEREIRAQMPEASVDSVDLAGRRDYRPGPAMRALALALLDASPRPARKAIARLVLGDRLRRRWAPAWRARLDAADAVVLGGGNLLSDADLNFPLKIDAALGLAHETDTPVGVFAVGVSDNWSDEGERLFARALGGAPLFFASVRDAASADIWRRRLDPAGVAPASVVGDPGLLASAHFPAENRPHEGPPVVGIGVMHPASVRYHARHRQAPAARQRQWWRQFVKACLARGWRLRLFTNGSPEDEAYLNQLAPDLRTLDPEGRATIAPRFAIPADLARFVAGLDLMFAHRLHANIAAYSYAVPQIGFAWDVKLASFLTGVGRGDCLATVGVDCVEAVVQLGERERRAGLDLVTHARVLARAREDVGRLVGAARDALAHARPRALLGASQAEPA